MVSKYSFVFAVGLCMKCEENEQCHPKMMMVVVAVKKKTSLNLCVSTVVS